MAIQQSNFQVPSRPASPRPIPRLNSTSEIKRPYSPFRMTSINYDQLQNTCMPRVAPPSQLFSPCSRAFSIPASTPSSSRSPSVVSWASFDTDYDDGLIIEEINSDEENENDSGIEVLVGEYEDPPSDDEYWERRRSSINDTIINGFEELSTSKSSPVCSFITSGRLARGSPTSSKRSYSNSASSDDDTDREDNNSEFGRRTRRRLQSRSPLNQSTPQITRGFNVTPQNPTATMEMEE